MKPKGFTLLEVLIASSTFLLMLGSLFAIYRMGATIWMRSDHGAELLGRVQTLSAKISREAERSLFDSLAIETRTTPSFQTGCSFLSARDNASQFQYDPGTRMPSWQSATIFYFDRSSHTVYHRSLPLGQANTRDNVTLYSEDFLQQQGEPPVLVSHFDLGTPIAHDIEDLSLEKPTRPVTLSGGRGSVDLPLRQLLITITVKGPRHGGGEQSITSQTVTFFRN